MIPQRINLRFDPLKLLANDFLSRIVTVPICPSTSCTTETLPKSLRSEFRATMAAGDFALFRYHQHHDCVPAAL